MSEKKDKPEGAALSNLVHDQVEMAFDFETVYPKGFSDSPTLPEDSAYLQVLRKWQSGVVETLRGKWFDAFPGIKVHMGIDYAAPGAVDTMLLYHGRAVGKSTEQVFKSKGDVYSMSAGNSMEQSETARQGIADLWFDEVKPRPPAEESSWKPKRGWVFDHVVDEAVFEAMMP